ncbi:GGDEF domain-containing protein [uncultured Clostridium sp.]|uniref:tetratricopeptide repeat-containing diguanylate cyclase n=1 Tax=uncultured Clostridium sp. TaxID=59620 RepID=UPI0025D80439|nr:GGDEF domain-containing protein [uncultured Clostridium sp.]
MSNKFEDTLLTIINNYNKKIKNSVDDETRAIIASDAMSTFLYEYNNPLAALIYGEIALKSILNTTNLTEEIKIRITIGGCYNKIGDDEKTISYLEPLITSKFSKLDKMIKYKLLFNLISCYIRLNDIDKASIYMEYFESLYQKNKDSEEEFTHFIYNIIKADFISLSRKDSFDDAFIHIENCKTYCESFIPDSEKPILMIELNRMASTMYSKLKQYDKAHELNLDSLKYIPKVDVESYSLDLYMLLSNDYKRQGDLKNSVKFIKEYIQKSEKRYTAQINQYSDILIRQYGIYNKENHLYKLNLMRDKISNKYNRDSLTGLYNRRFLDTLINTSNVNDSEKSIAMIDVDFFKKYNDNYGHLKGDKILKKVGKTIFDLFNTNNYIPIRYGGEEFIIIMNNTSYEESITLIDNLIKKIRDENIPHEYSEASDRVTISIGIETAPIVSNSEFWAAIKSADEALYTAKKQGRNRYIHSNDIKK